MGMKSRGNWLVSRCFKACENRGAACARCLRFSQFSEIKARESVLAGKTDTKNNVIKSTKQ